MTRGFVATVALALVLGAGSAGAKPPDTWDGLHLVKSPKMDAVYLLPEADFRPYTKVILDPVEVAFKKNWQRDVSSASSLSGRITDKDAQKIADAARTGFDRIFNEAYSQAGWQIVTEPGPDVLRVSTAVLNLYIAAPEKMTAGITRTFSVDAGEATLALEARDSQTNALLGRAIDQQTVGDEGGFSRNRVTNTADFERLFRGWAKSSLNGLNELKALSPIDTEGRLNR